MRLAELYFDHCFQLFRQREKQAGAVERFIRIGDRFTVCFKFAGPQLVDRFFRPFAHLAIPGSVDAPDLTLCVWDSATAPDTVPPRPSWNDERLKERNFIRSVNVRIFSDVEPNTLSVLDTNRRTGLFWISDSDQLPWLEKAHPFSTIMSWWSLREKLQFLHAGCVGMPDNGALIIGNPGAGKSTLSLSSLSENFLYASDDFCLADSESGVAMAYSLYCTGMVSGPDHLVKLDASNVDRSSEPKAILSVYECFPDKIMKKVRISLIVLLSGNESTGPLIEPMEPGRAIAALASSTASAMKMIGYSADDFLGLHRLLSKIPCFQLHRSADLSATNRQIAELLNRAKREGIP